MKLSKRPVQRISLAIFYGVFMYASTAQSVFAVDSATCNKLEGGITGGVDCAIGEDSKAKTDLFGDEGIFSRIIEILLFLVGAISVVMLIIGGIRYVLSSGDQNAVTAAKNTILYAIIGLVVAFLAFGAVRFVTGALAPEGI